MAQANTHEKEITVTITKTDKNGNSKKEEVK